MGWPNDDELVAAWRRLLDDPTAGGAFLALTLRPLVEALAVWRPAADPHAVETAAEEALLAFLKRPVAYDQAKSTLPAYLRLIARRRLLNHFAAERRHHAGRIPWESVELGATDRNDPAGDDSPSFDTPAVQDVITAFSDGERRVFDLTLAGERRTAVFADAMGLSDRPADEQEREVKRAKDRIKARLKRAAGGGDG